MSQKLPTLQLYTGDWLKDPAVSMCSPATRGIWIDFLCAMHEYHRSGVISGTIEQLTRVGRCSVVELAPALNELSTSGAADVTKRNEVVTIINRRMKREADERKATNKRVRRHRARKISNEKETPYSSSSSSVTEKEKLKKAKEIFEQARKIYPGTKRGLDTEFVYFCKMHKDWRDVLPLLKPAIERQISYRKKAKGFVPEWKHFKTWLYSKSWEEEAANYGQADDESCVVCRAEGKKFQVNGSGKKIYLCDECFEAFRKIRNNWVNLPLSEIEKIVLEGKAKR